MGVKISNLPAIATPALSDIFPVVQSGVTYKESFTQLTSLFAIAGANNNITSFTNGIILPSITFNSTTGIIGTTTNDSAAAGSVGQIISSSVPAASAIALTTITAANITSISLSAGNWNVYGNVIGVFTGNSTALQCWCSLTSATVPDVSLTTLFNYASTATLSVGGPTPYINVKLAAPTTVYLSAFVTFSTGACGGSGNIYAIRVR